MTAPFTPRRFALAAAIACAALLPAYAGAQGQVSPQMKAQAMSLAMTCRADFEKLCPNVQPGGGRALACLQQHQSQLSDGCRKAMPQAQALKNQAAASGVLPK